MDGHRKCNIRFTPEESKENNGICPACSRPLTLGVLYRVSELADRPHDIVKPDGINDFKSLIPSLKSFLKLGALALTARKFRKLMNRL